VEAVHVQLPDERRIVVVLEQLGYQGLSKLVFVQHNERIASIRPANEIRISRFFKEASAYEVSKQNLD